MILSGILLWIIVGLLRLDYMMDDLAGENSYWFDTIIIAPAVITIGAVSTIVEMLWD